MKDGVKKIGCNFVIWSLNNEYNPKFWKKSPEIIIQKVRIDQKNNRIYIQIQGRNEQRFSYNKEISELFRIRKMTV